MMIQDDHVHAAILQPLDWFNGGRSAIHGEEQADGKFLEAMGHPIGAEPVAFLQPVREIVVHAPAHPAQKLGQQSGRGNAIHVVITKDHHRFTGFPRPHQPADSGIHVGQEERVRETFEFGVEKFGGGDGIGQSPLQEALGEKGRDAELFDQRLSHQGLRRGDGPAEFHNPAAGGVLFSRAAAIREARMDVAMIPTTTPRDKPMGISMCQIIRSILIPI